MFCVVSVEGSSSLASLVISYINDIVLLLGKAVTSLKLSTDDGAGTEI